MASSEPSASEPVQPPGALSPRKATKGTIAGLAVVVGAGLLIYYVSTHTPLPWIVAVLAGVFGGLFVGVVLAPTDWRAWFDKTFSRIPVIVLGSWLGMALTMGSMTVYIFDMHEAMMSMSQDIAVMKGDMTGMSEDMGLMSTQIFSMSAKVAVMSDSVVEMSDDVQQIDDFIDAIDNTLSYEIGPAVRVMAPAVTDMGHSMHRGVQSFSNPMEYMRNAFMPFP